MIKRLTLGLSSIFEKPFPAGELLSGRYRIKELLGSGGYGHSYLVHDQEQSRDVVIKALRLHKRISASGRKSFLREKDYLERLNHPGIPAYLGSGEHRGIPYFAMEYIEGENFEQLIFRDGKVFEECEVFETSAKLLEILDFLHSRNIIHRDIRIPNVILSKGDVFLLDLGLASFANEPQGRHLTGHNALRRGKNPQADFYGLGHFILFLLYSSYTADEGQKERSWDEELQISNEAKMIIRRLLRINGEYQSSTEIKKDIYKLLNREEITNVIV